MKPHPRQRTRRVSRSRQHISSEANTSTAMNSTNRRPSGKRGPNPWPKPTFDDTALRIEAEDFFGFTGASSAGFGAHLSQESRNQSRGGASRTRQPSLLSPDLALEQRNQYYFGQPAGTPDSKNTRSGRRSGRRSRSERKNGGTGGFSGVEAESQKSNSGGLGLGVGAQIEKQKEPERNVDDTSKSHQRNLYYSSYSYGANNISEHMNSALQLGIDDTPSPRGLTRNPGNFGGKTAETRPMMKAPAVKKERTSANWGAVLPLPPPPPPPNSATTIIETRRTEIRDGGVFYEELQSISFPTNLPPNVHIHSLFSNPQKV